MGGHFGKAATLMIVADREKPGMFGPGFGVEM